MIDFTKAFDLAWERMVVILFRPFDLGKWCTIGLGAFLAGMLSGGNGFNGGSFNQNFDPNSFKNTNVTTQTQTFPKVDLNTFNASIAHAVSGMQIGLIIFIALIVIAIVFAFIFLIYWLGARGQFVFLDNIVRNRGEVAGPWTRYARQANSVFGFYLLVMLVSLLLFLPIIVIGIVMALPLFHEHRWPVGGEIAGFVGLGVVYLAMVLVFSIVLFLFREFGIPIMFRQGLLARPAFLATLNLARLHPVSVALFVLLRFALFVAVAIISVIVCCASCCTGLLPYVGTVMLLPALVYVRCFTLDCLAQFGPQYDVWTVDVTPPELVANGPFIPPRPLG